MVKGLWDEAAAPPDFSTNGHGNGNGHSTAPPLNSPMWGGDMNTNKVCEPNADAPEISDIANLWTSKCGLNMGGQPGRRTGPAHRGRVACIGRVSPGAAGRRQRKPGGLGWAYCPARTGIH